MVKVSDESELPLPLVTAQRETDESITKLLAKKAEVRARAGALAERQRALEKKRKELAEKHGGTAVKGSDRLKLNVGGQRVVTTRDTLTLFPFTRLAALFSGRWEQKLQRDRKGNIFLDVNPVVFKKIVEHHQFAKIAAPDDPPPEPTVPDDLKDVLATVLDRFGLSILWEPELPPPFALDSAVLQPANAGARSGAGADRASGSAALADALREWLVEAGKDVSGGLELLFRGSRDGLNETAFHAKCDPEAQTLTLIRSSNGGIFGGYSDQPWGGNGYKQSNGSFLFSLVNPAGLPPSKLPLIAGRNANAIYAHPSRGPTFGGGNDLLVQPNMRQGSTNTGHTYRLPSGQQAAYFLAGANPFEITEIEVFKVAATAAPLPPPPPRKITSVAIANRSAAGVKAADKCASGEKVADKKAAAASRKLAPTPAPTPDAEETKLASITELIVRRMEAENDALASALEELCKEEQMFAEEEGFVALFCGEVKDVVDLDVTGERMSVKRSTLRLIEGSALAAKFDDARWSQRDGGGGKDDDDSDDEHVHIDFGAYSFGKIIDHLRLLALTEPDARANLPRPIVRADEQQNFSRLISFWFPGQEDVFILRARLDSAILEGDASRALEKPLLEWLVNETGAPPAKLDLVFRSSRDGLNMSTWRARVCNAAHTLTLIRSANNFIFGGFSDLPWTTPNGYKQSSLAFLFSLVNPAGLPPTKLPLRGTSNENAVYCHPSHGPTFGGGHDLMIQGGMTQGHNNLGHTYQLPPGQQANYFFAEANPFDVAQMEVFALSF